MNTQIHRNSLNYNTLEQPRPAFVTTAGTVYRQAAQGGIRRCTALDLALMSIAAEVVCWRLEANRQEG